MLDSVLDLAYGLRSTGVEIEREEIGTIPAVMADADQLGQERRPSERPHGRVTDTICRHGHSFRVGLSWLGRSIGGAHEYDCDNSLDREGRGEALLLMNRSPHRAIYLVLTAPDGKFGIYRLI